MPFDLNKELKFLERYTSWHFPKPYGTEPDYSEPRCYRCNRSGEGQKWNADTRIMETVVKGCNYCEGKGYK